MEQHRKVLNIGLAVIGGLALIGLIIGTFLDQKIATSLGNFDNVYGILFTMLAPVLALSIGELAGALLVFIPKIENKVWDIILRALGAVAFIAFTAFSIKEGIEYVDFPKMAEYATTYKVLAITLVAILDVAIILFVKLAMKHIDAKRIIPVVIVVFAIFACWVLVSEVIKHLASRPRPRVVYFEPFFGFKNWYEFRPFLCLKDGYKECKSFVSGHAFIAGCSISSIPLIYSLRKDKCSTKTTIIGLAVGGAFAFITAFSRIVAYAHFMSDVMGAIVAACASQAVILNVAPLIYKKCQK